MWENVYESASNCSYDIVLIVRVGRLLYFTGLYEFKIIYLFSQVATTVIKKKGFPYREY